MKQLLTATFLLIAVTGCATNQQTITMEMALSIDGKLVSQPTVVANLGEMASITVRSDDGEDTFIEVTPTLRAKDEIHMKFAIGELVDGKKTILSKLQFVTRVGEEAELAQESTDGPYKSISLTVTARL